MTVLRAAPAARLLSDADLPQARRLLSRDPVASCFVATRVTRAGLTTSRLGAEVWGYGSPTLEALCWSGANLVPVGGGPRAWDAFVGRARRQGRRCSSIVGPAAAVRHLWAGLRPHWGAAREERLHQPLLAISCAPSVAPDPRVRRTRREELDVVLPAAVAMFTEEVGVSPVADGGRTYRARLSELVDAGRSYVRLGDGRVEFKAEVGALTREAAQVQGVWVEPSLRGRGLGAAGTAAVVAALLADGAPVVSLYVNDYNAPALRAYERVGMQQVGEFATILF